MNPSSVTIDTRHTVETPEGARLQVTVAGPIIRGIAWSIDAAIRVAIYIIVIVALLTANESLIDTLSEEDVNSYTFGISLLLYFVLGSLYPIILEATFGTTPGKRVFNLVVVHDNATPLSVGGSVIRNLLRFIDFLPMIYFVGLVSTLTDNRFRRLGDLAAGTLVIYKDTDEYKGSAFSHKSSSAPPNGLNREERLAIVDFAERSSSLSGERQRELAAKLAYLMDTNADPVETLKGWAEWILRGQTGA